MVGLALPEPSAEPPQATPAELNEYFGAMAGEPPFGSRLLLLGWVMSAVQASPPNTNAPISLAIRIMVLYTVTSATPRSSNHCTRVSNVKSGAGGMR